MADVLYYAALDKYLYADTQLDAATDQATRANNRFQNAKTTLNACKTCLECCKCCFCCEEYNKQNASAGLEGLVTLNQCLMRDSYCGLDKYCQAWCCIPDTYPDGSNPSERCHIWVIDQTVLSHGSVFGSNGNNTGLNCCCTAGGAYWRCGSCCYFVVPSGVTKVQFTGWGPGNSTGGISGCGGSPYGSTGAFFTTTIDVTAGEGYTVCAGCAYCCYPGQNDVYYSNGGATWIQGPGLCNLCADPGRHSFINVQAFNNGMSCRCRAGVPWCMFNNSGGGCYCACSTYYCFDNSCASCGCLSTIGNRMFAYGCSPRAIIYKVMGHYGGWCYDTNHYGHTTEPGVPFMCGANYNWTCCVGCHFCWTSGTCYGKCCAACCIWQIRGKGERRMPGLGGTMSHTMGGQGNCGDAGRGGGVRISFICP